MKKPEVILWDWDGTLLNTIPLSRQALHQLGAETNVSISDSDVAEVLGGHLVDFWYRHYGPDPIPYIRRFIGFYQELSPKAQAFPEAKPILSFIHNLGIPQIVVSNKNQEIILAEADRLQLTPYFSKIVGTINQGIGKPEKAFADSIFGSHWPTSSLMIGDGHSDMAFGKMLNAFSILIHPTTDSVSYHYDLCLPDLGALNTFLHQQSWSQTGEKIP